MSFDFNTAVKLYKENPTSERLSEVSEKLLSEMTLKEKIRMMRGHAMGVTIKNVFTRGRYYNGEAYPDTPEEIKKCINNSGLTLIEHYETEFANVFVCKKA